ncbi:hypothetical protein C8R44DRAFT_973296 [Mycena epipterygia]|nr:hypothetical protein C8R44DRAFT_973296 [Mycena epipterygia]
MAQYLTRIGTGFSQLLYALHPGAQLAVIMSFRRDVIFGRAGYSGDTAFTVLVYKIPKGFPEFCSIALVAASSVHAVDAQTEDNAMFYRSLTWTYCPRYRHVNKPRRWAIQVKFGLFAVCAVVYSETFALTRPASPFQLHARIYLPILIIYPLRTLAIRAAKKSRIPDRVSLERGSFAELQDHWPRYAGKAPSFRLFIFPSSSPSRTPLPPNRIANPPFMVMLAASSSLTRIANHTSPRAAGQAGTSPASL